MPLEHPNITLGTAGHIDHGKTALIKFLTGCDTDRLKAEKERGMSIDLGFAPCTIAGMQVGIVDVPGHERFVKTMVAGASGMDGVIFVVAADDGVMPQTREHLEILSLLGVQHGVVALTKTDRVAAEELELVRAQVKDCLRGTFLRDAPILPVCNLTGEGFEPFYEALAELVGAIKPKRTDGPFRLPVERAFAVKGYGTVVAGIPVSGSARIGDEVILLPRGTDGRVRRIEVYQRASDAVLAGQCAALNVTHWDHRVIKRGDTVAAPGYFSPHQWYACTLQLLPHEKLFLKSGARVKFHTGTSEVPAAVYLMEGERLRAGEECLVQVKLSAQLVAGPGDPFILRTLSPVESIGGGTIIEAIPAKLKRTRPGVREDLQERARAVPNEKDFVEYCLRKAESVAADAAEISFRSKVPPARVQEILTELLDEGKVITVASGLYVHSRASAEAGEKMLGIVAGYHRQSPESPGLTWERLQEASGLARNVLEAIVRLLKEEGSLVEANGRLALPDHQVEFSEQDRAYLEAAESLFRERGYRPPGPDETGEHIGVPSQKLQWILKTLVEHARLVQVAENLLFHREAVDSAREALVSFIRREGKLESVKFKYLLDTTRKFAIPLLDYFDRIGVTQRVGHTRYLRGQRDAGAGA